jgi:tetratricopeptide (TPR) repeat protein
MRAPRFVGREAEISAVTKRLLETRNGETRMVVVDGPAGIGKTRFAERICEIACNSGYSILRGHCPPGPTIPFSGVHDICREVGAELPATEIGSGRSGTLSVDSTAFCWDLVAHLRTRLENDSSLIFLEDAHWADSQSLEALQKMVRNCRRRAFFLVTCRTGESGKGLEFLRTLTEEFGGEWIHLDILSIGDISAMLQDVLDGEGDAESVEMLAIQSEGNPLQGIGMLRTMVLAGRLERQSGSWALSKEYLQGGVGLSQMVHEALTAIPSEEMAVIQASSVLGQAFAPETVGRMTSFPIGRVTSICRQLSEDAGFFMKRGEEFEYAHDILRSMIYDGISPEIRQALHLAASRALEADGDPCPAGVLSWHFLLGGDGESSLKYSLRAGAQCFASCSLPEALEYYERAYGLSSGTEHAQERIESLEGIATVHLELSNYDSSLPFFAELLAMDLQPRTRARVLRKCAEAWNPTKLGKGSDHEMMQFIAEFERIPEADEFDRGEVCNLKAITALWRGDMDSADIAFTESEGHFAGSHDQRRLASQLAYHVTVQLSRGDTANALEGAKKAMMLLGKSPDPTPEMEVDHFLAHALLNVGKMEEAIWHFRRSASLASLVGDVTYECWSHINLALALEMLDDAEGAWHESVQAMTAAGTSESTYLAISALGMKAHLDFVLGREEALAEASRLTSISETYKWGMKTSTHGMVAVVKAEEAAAKGEADEMSIRYEEALELFAGASMGNVYRGMTHLWFARDLANGGHRERTLIEFATAAEVFSSIGNEFMHAKVSEELASLMR